MRCLNMGGWSCFIFPSPAVSHFPALWVRCFAANLHRFLALFLKEARGNSEKSHFLPTTGSIRSLSQTACFSDAFCWTNKLLDCTSDLNSVYCCLANPWKCTSTELCHGWASERHYTIAILLLQKQYALYRPAVWGKRGNGYNTFLKRFPVALNVQLLKSC